MPNYKLSGEARDGILSAVRNAMQKRIDYALSEFPLDVSTLQAGLLTASQLADVHSLARSGFGQLITVRQVSIALTRERYPGLHRGLPVDLTLPMGGVYEPFASYYPSLTSDRHWAGMANSRVHLLTLGADDTAKLADWGNAVVRALRTREIVTHTAGLVVAGCKSSAEVLAAWPILGTLFDDGDPWKAKFRNPPRHLERWAPEPSDYHPTHWFERVRLIEASETALNTALLLEPYQPPAGAVVAKAPIWEHLPNDRKYSFAS